MPKLKTPIVPKVRKGNIDLPERKTIEPMSFSFQTEHFEENKISEKDLVRLMPYGMSLDLDPSRPMLLLRDESGQHTLPVFFNADRGGSHDSAIKYSMASDNSAQSD